MHTNSTEQVLEQVMAEARSNSAFMKQLTNDPIVAIKSFTGRGVELPEGIERLVVCDQSDPKTAYFNIPAVVEADFELTEEQLEAVAGGAGIPKNRIIVCFYPSPGGTPPFIPGPPHS